MTGGALPWCFLTVLVLAAPSPARAQTPADSVPHGNARAYDAVRPWFVEATLGGVRPGPDGTDFGNGQHYAVHFGAQTRPRADIAIGIGWINARQADQAIDSDITYGILRPRVWLGDARFLAYAEGGIGLYRFSVQQQSVSSDVVDDKLRFGGLLGIGIHYVRSKYWVGFGARVHGAIGSSSLESGSLMTLTTYDASVGTPLWR